MNRADALSLLTRLFASTPDASPLFDNALDNARVVDAAGNAPTDDAWTETIDGWWAASLVADQLDAVSLASNVGTAPTVTEFTSEGSSFTLAGTATWADVAAAFRARSSLHTPGIGVVEVASVPTYIPRSRGANPWLNY